MKTFAFITVRVSFHFRYTRETFLYKMLNAALLRRDTKILYKFHFFIKDLHMQIEQLHSLYKPSLKERTFTVFRGLSMPMNVFDEKIRKQNNNLIGFDNFLSTSLFERVGRAYALINKMENTEAILLRISINADELQRPFADISRLSYFGNEGEILFSIGTVFRIIQVAEEKDKDGIWIVELTSVGENDQFLKHDTEETQQTLLKFFKRVHRAHTKANTQNHSQIAASLANIARMYYKQGDYEESLKDYQKARDILIKSSPNDSLSIATYESNIAMVQDAMGRRNEALDHYQTALNTRRQLCRSDDPILINTFRAIGHIYFKEHEWKKALEFYDHARQTQLSSAVPPDEVDPQPLAASHIYSALVHQQLHQHEQALEHLSKALTYQLKYLPKTHPILAFLYNNIGAMCFRLEKFDKALENHLQCLLIEQGSLPSDHFAFVETYHNIATTYERLKQFNEAVQYAQHAVDQSKLHRNEDDLKHKQLLRHLQNLEDEIPL